MNLYNNYILPRLLNFGMNKEDINKLRPDVVEDISGTVLEIGFGSGLNLPYYKDINKLYALEPSEELFNLSKDRIKEVKFPIEYIKASAEKIPFSDNSMDAVVSTFTVCSIHRVENALKEIYRILKPGGRFYFIEHGKSPKNFLFTIQKIITPVSKHLTGGCHLDRNIDDLIREAGLNLEKIEKFQEKYRPLMYLYRGIGIKK